VFARRTGVWGFTLVIQNHDVILAEAGIQFSSSAELIGREVEFPPARE
jgi:hypothetical protein